MTDPHVEMMREENASTVSETTVIIGYSEGGSMAALFAAAHPERTIGLVLRGIFLATPAEFASGSPRSAAATTSRPTRSCRSFLSSCFS